MSNLHLVEVEAGSAYCVPVTDSSARQMKVVTRINPSRYIRGEVGRHTVEVWSNAGHQGRLGAVDAQSANCRFAFWRQRRYGGTVPQQPADFSVGSKLAVVDGSHSRRPGGRAVVRRYNCRSVDVDVRQLDMFWSVANTFVAITREPRC